MIYKLAQNRVSRTYGGGRNIDSFTGEIFKGEGFYPEDWTASTVSAISQDGKIEGYGMTDCGKSVRDTVGEDGLPILVKLLDAGERLAVQVHPTAEFATENLGSRFGKTECWYMLGCDEDACVYLGFRKGVTKELWKEAIMGGDSKRILSMLCRIPVRKGDFVFVGGGIVHAIGKGCFLAELQEPSDLMTVAETKTESGRDIPSFRLDMGLGLDKALDMYDYTGFSEDELRGKYVFRPDTVKNGVTSVCTKELTDKFSMAILNGNARYNPERRCAVAIVISGEGKLCGRRAARGERFLIVGDKDSENCIRTEGDEAFSVILCE